MEAGNRRKVKGGKIEEMQEKRRERGDGEGEDRQEEETYGGGHREQVGGRGG